MLFSLSAFLNGLGVSFGLIIAIGMQNAFVLKQGILKNHVFLIAIFCSLIDSLLIIIGVNGLGAILSKYELALKIFNWGGILFLFGYGIISFILCFKKQSLDIDQSQKILSAKQVLKTLLVVSFLNPHTYLDTCVLVASIATHFKVDERMSFTMGAILASFIWFFFLSYGARFLRVFFAKPLSWKILDFMIGCTMFSIATSLMVTMK